MQSLLLDVIDEDGRTNLINRCKCTCPHIGVVRHALRCIEGALESINGNGIVTWLHGTLTVPPADVSITNAFGNVVAAKVVNADRGNFWMRVKVALESLSVLPPVGVGM